MNLSPSHIEAQPAPGCVTIAVKAGFMRKLGDIWRDGSCWYEQTASGTWDLPTIEREPLLFGYRVVGRELDMPCLNATESAEVHAERLECFDENRNNIRRGLQMDAVDFRRLVEHTPWLDELQRVPC